MTVRSLRPGWRLNVQLTLGMSLLLGALLACKKSGIQDESRVERQGAPADVQLSRVTAALKCSSVSAGTPKAEACRVARDFASATPVSTWPTSGRDTWYGRTFRILSGKTDAVVPYFFQVEPGSLPATSLSMNELKFVLPVHGKARDLIPENASERADADAVLAALIAGTPVPESAAVQFMKTTAPQNGYLPLANGAAGSAIVIGKFPLFVRQSGQRLVMVEPHEQGGGWFSELWKLP